MGVYVLDTLDAAAVRRWVHAAATSLEQHRAEVDRLNVFPVHDSDTGTNLATTLRAAADAVDAEASADPAQVLRVLATGAVLGASGNSGTIIAQVLRALSIAVADSGSCDASTLRAGLRLAAEQARTAVADPVEGTILSVLRAAAEAVPADAGSPAAVAGVALAAADEALSRTPEQLPVLARAGVVDAGGQGLVLVLEALVRALGATPPDIAPVPTDAPATLDCAAGAGGGAFEVQYLLDTSPGFDERSAGELRAALARLGDSVVVVGTGEGTWSVHVHADDVGAVVEAGIGAGRPYRIAVSRFDTAADAPKPAALIAVAPGPEVAKMFEAERVHVVPGPEPTVGDIVEAVLATGMRQVVLLPNSRPGAVVAEAAAERMRGRGARIAVVATRSPVQGLAAVAVHDAARPFDDDVVAMAEAAAATRVAEVSVAERRALTSAGVCQAGDVLGLIDGEVVEIGRGRLAVTLAVLDRLLGVGAELMTVLVGADAKPGIGELVRRHVRQQSPLTEITVYDVGEAGLNLIIGVE